MGRALAASMALANQVILTHKDLSGGSDYGPGYRRAIYYSSGHTLLVPEVGPTATVVISILIGAQLIVLLLLATFIYRVPTWSTVLDALSMASVGASLGPKVLPSIGSVGKGTIHRLRDLNGLIGVVAEDEERDSITGDAVRGTHTESTSLIEAGGRSPPRAIFALPSPGEGVESTTELLSIIKSRDGASSARRVVQLELGAHGPIDRTTQHKRLRPIFRRAEREPERAKGYVPKCQCNNCLTARARRQKEGALQDDSSSS
jgi:hypothetical protein